MIPYFEDSGMTLFLGDVLEVLREMPDESVQCVVTSPPYWALRDYGIHGQLGLEPLVSEYLENVVAVFAEVRRVLANDGTCWLNLGDTFAGGRRGGNPGASEHVKQRSNKGSLRVPMETPEGLKPKDLVGIPWRVAFALQSDGWWLRSDIIWHKPNPMPESVTDRPTKAHEYIFLLTRNDRYFYDADAIREPYLSSDLRRHSARWPQGWATGDDPHSAIAHNVPQSHNGSSFVRGKTRKADVGQGPREDHPKGRNKRSVWTVATQPFSDAHFATFPLRLVEPCILAGSREGDAVLDPFVGSGTTALVAQKHGRKAIGIDINSDYLDMAIRRNAQKALWFSEVAS